MIPSGSAELRRVLPAMMAIFVDCLSYGLVTPMIVAVFSQDVFLSGQPGWLVEFTRCDCSRRVKFSG